MCDSNNLREIPSVNLLLQSDQGKKLIEDYSHEIVVQGIREGIDRLRSGEVELAEEKKQIQEDILKMTRGIIEEKFALSLKRTINGTGTIIHTNLGRAKLSPSVKDALLEVAFSFSNLEYNIEEGSRGSRYQHLEEMLCNLTGAGGALVVNNNAAAIMLALDTVAKGREVIVSRGELVEIGGSFRIPEIIELSGCKLKEIGTTNKTHDFDYQTAVNEETAAVLKVHSSNYKISGFTKSVSIDELSMLLHGKDSSIIQQDDKSPFWEEAKPIEIPLIHDMGSGMLINLEKYGLPYEMTVRDSLEAGADIVTFSGDKVLGGPQAGIILGKKKYIDAMKKNQLTRALRVDKMTIATLEATLRLYYDQEEALKQIPTLNMLVITLEELEEKAKILAEKLSILGDKVKVEVLDTTSQVGGGAYPGEEIPSKAVAISTDLITANQLSESLRKAPVPIISKIRNQKCELDARTIDVEEFPVIVGTLTDIFNMN